VRRPRLLFQDSTEWGEGYTVNEQLPPTEGTSHPRFRFHSEGVSLKYATDEVKMLLRQAM
jgi:hypothetical protein